MKRAMTLTLCLSVIPGAIAQEANTDATKAEAANEPIKQPEALEILRKADAATKALKFVKYTATFKGTGAAASRAPQVEGSAVLAGESRSGLDKFFFQVKATRPGSSDVREFTAGSDGDVSFLIDPRAKKAYEDIDPAVLGSDGRLAQSLAMREFTHPTPFSDEINGESAILKGTTKIGDEECYEIHIKYAAAQRAKWFFSKRDYLPRAVERIFPSQDGAARGTLLTLTNLVTNPKFDKDPFKLVLPEGFEKTDDFAPVRRAPM